MYTGAAAGSGVDKVQQHNEQQHAVATAGSGAEAIAASVAGGDVAAEQVGSVSPNSKFKMSLNFSRLLAGSAVHVNSALPGDFFLFLMRICF